MAEIARRAGVVRAPIYVHFPTREALLEAVTHRAIAEVAAVIEAAEPHRGDPAEALARVVAASWRILGRYRALVAINTQQHGHAELRQRHSSVLASLEPLIERGQADGTFRADVPAAWHLSMLLALMHAASGELGAGRVDDDDAGPALVATVLGAVAAAGTAMSRGADTAPSASSPAIRAAMLWGIVVGVLQAATPLVFWWLDSATVYALGLAVIAAIYIGFAVADGRPKVIAVESSVAFAFVVVAAAAVTGSPWLLVAGLAGHGLKDLWQHRSHFVANTRWWPPFCMVVDWVVAAIIVGEIAAGMHFD